MQTREKSLAQKVDEQIFEKLLKYNPQTQNLWDIVGLFEHERQKLRLEIAAYLQEIKDSKAKLKELREHITLAQNALNTLEKKHSQMPKDSKINHDEYDALKQRIAELELENSKLLVEMRDLKSEYQLEENLQQLSQNPTNSES